MSSMICLRTNDSKKDDTFPWQFKVASVVIVLVSFAPVVIFIQGKLTGSKDGTGDWNRDFTCTSISSSLLTTSVCERFLLQMTQSTTPPIDNSRDDNTASDTASNISFVSSSRCSFESTEKELNVLSSYSSFVTPACAEGIMSLTCRYLYRPCSTDPSITPATTVTLDECLSLKDNICRESWPLVQLGFAESSCLTSFIDCNLDSGHPTDQTRTTTNPSNESNWSTEDRPVAHAAVNNTTVVNGISCKAPFIPPHDPQILLPCVPPCPPEEAVVEKQLVTANKVFVYLSITVQYFCYFIILYTWARAKELRRLPHAITFFMVVQNLIRTVVFSIPFFVGQRQTMCQYQDVSSSFNFGSTTFCVIQGAILHFTFLSTFILLCCSVFNVLVAVLDWSPDSFIKRHPKLVLLLEFTVATVIPGCTVLTVLRKGSYMPDWLFLTTCIPRRNDNIFYAYTLPAQIFSITGMIMCILIIRRIKQSTTMRASISSNERGIIAQMALSRRFLVLVVFIPFSFLVMFTALEAFLIHQENNVGDDAAEYAFCLLNASPGKTCSSSSNVRGQAAIVILLMIYMATFSILLVVYSFIPAPAIRVWTRHKEQLSRCCVKINIPSSFRRRETNVTETTSMV